MTDREKIQKVLKEIQAEIKNVEKIDVPSYQLGVIEGLTMALEILRALEYKTN